MSSCPAACVKGPNVLVDHRGVCKLSDFGCSKELYGEVASANTLKGTPQFMAPEVLLNRGAGYTDKADVWCVRILNPPHAPR